MSTHESADRLRAIPGSQHYVRSDSGGSYNLIEYDQTRGAMTTGYAVSRHGSLLRFVQTGYANVPGKQMKRCRITVARDPGYADDTVIFDDECESFGGVMPGAIACRDPRPRLRERLMAVTELAQIAGRYQ